MRLASLLFISVFFSLTAMADGTISKDCAVGKECIIEVPGAVCGDGTPSFITLTKRAGSKNLLVYLSGGGACWSDSTCHSSQVKTLTREENPTDWEHGAGAQDANDAANPFAKDYDVITVPYCTGDAFTGNKDTNYGSDGDPYIVHHRGYQNVKLMLDSVRKLYPKPQKAVLLGVSAGGIGAYYQLRNFAAAFPGSERYVISDAGTPFRPPYIHEQNYRNIMVSWGADTTMPVDKAEPVADFAGLIRYNTQHYPDVRFGFISSYRDTVMTFFALSAGSPAPFRAVKEAIIDVADNYIGRETPNAKVFYTESSRHVHTEEALGDLTSEGTSLSSWIGAMLGDVKGWASVRPDLQRRVLSAEEAHDVPIHSADELRNAW